MAAGNFGSPMQLLILLAIVLLLFGGKRLRNLGGDLGTAIKGFKNSVASSDDKSPEVDKLIHERQSFIDTSNELNKADINAKN